MGGRVSRVSRHGAKTARADRVGVEEDTTESCIKSSDDVDESLEEVGVKLFWMCRQRNVRSGGEKR